MNKNTIKKVAALLCGITILPLTVNAQSYKYVTTSTSEAGQSYFSSTNPAYAALQVNGTTGNVVYSGTNINATGTGNAANNGRYGLYVYNGGTAFIQGGTLAATGTSASSFAARLLSGGYASLDRVTIVQSGSSPNGIALSLGQNSRADLTDTNITSTGSGAHGLYMDGTSQVTAARLQVATSGTGARGIYVAVQSQFTGSSVQVNTAGNSAYGFYLNTSQATVSDLQIQTLGDGAYGFYVSATSQATVSDVTVTTSGSAAHGIYLLGTSQFTGNGLNVTVNGGDSHGISVTNGSTFTGSAISVTHDGDSQGAMIFAIRVSGSGSQLNVTDVTVNATGHAGRGVRVEGGATATIENLTVITSGSTATGLFVAGNGGDVATVAHVTHAYIQTSGHEGADGIGLATANRTELYLTSATVSVSGTNSNGVYMNPTRDAYAKLVLDDVSISAGGGAGMSVHPQEQLPPYTAESTVQTYSGTFDLTVKNGSVITAQESLRVYSLMPATDSGGNDVWVEVPTTVFLNVETSSTLNGDIAIHNSATTTVNLSGNSALNGSLIVSDTAALTVTLDNSTFTGASTLSGNAITNLTLNNSAWNMTGKSKVTTLSSSGGSITIANVQGDDLTVSNGITGQTALHLTLSDGVKSQTEIRVVVDETNAMSDSAFTLGNEVSVGIRDYSLENRPDGAWLVSTALSQSGDAILNTTAAVSGFWFTQLDNLHKRMGELRKSEDGKVKSESLVENVWVRAYGQQINANTGITGVKGFSETQYGVDLGTDHLWNLDADNQLYTGIFAGYGGADRDFHTSYNGSTDSGYGGIYATWINTDGWYADVVAKGQYFRNDFSGADSGKYDSIGVGFSVELGKQFEFNDGWFAEPSIQVSYLHLMNDNYTTRDGMSVTLSDADVLHFYGGARFGRNIKLANSGLLQPYIKVGGLEQISSGNKLTVSGDHWRPNLDGARAILGAGLVWQLDTDNQLHLDYEASFGDKYDKPWGLNFGYRHQF